MDDPIVTEKLCTRCNQVKPLSEFPINRRLKSGRGTYCKACHSANMKGRRPPYNPKHREEMAAWRQTAAGKNGNYVNGQRCQARKEANWRRKRKLHYAPPARFLTLDEYEQMLKEQNGGCAICGNPPTSQRLAVDHCHKTGKIRALLCSLCNNGLGCFRDNPDLLETAKRFLITHSQ